MNNADIRIPMKLLFSLPFRWLNLLLSHYTNKIIPKPFELHFETTYRCTCKCVFCDRWKKGPQRVAEELGHGEIKKLIDQAYDIGIRIISLSGGEPLLKEGLLPLMQYAKSKGMITQINTNGTLISKKNILEVLKCFDIILVSIDSLDEQSHDTIRGVKSTFRKALKTIFLLKKHSKNNFVGVSSVLSGKNIDEIIKINKFFMGKQIPTFFQPIHNNPGNLFNVSNDEYLHFEPESRKKFKKIIKNYLYPNKLIKYMYRNYFSKALDFIIDPISTFNQFTCFAGSYSLFVDPYGDVFPCDIHRVKIGNIREESLKNIFKSKKFNDVRRQIKNRKCHCWLLCSAPIFINLSRLLRLLRKNEGKSGN